MSSMKRNMIGLAGELRVMSELLLRNHNPAKSYLEDGADLILENGKKIEVKSAHRVRLKRTSGYIFSFRGGRRGKKQKLDGDGFVICWCIDDDVFYIIPVKAIGNNQSCIGIYNVSLLKNKYSVYKENWKLLN